MPTIDKEQRYLTLINTFTVKPENADALLDVLVTATRDVIQHVPGFVSASFHVNDDKTRIANYAQWTSQQALDAMLQRADARPHLRQATELAESFEPITYDLAYTHDVAENRS